MCSNTFSVMNVLESNEMWIESSNQNTTVHDRKLSCVKAKTVFSPSSISTHLSSNLITNTSTHECDRSIEEITPHPHSIFLNGRSRSERLSNSIWKIGSFLKYEHAMIFCIKNKQNLFRNGKSHYFCFVMSEQKCMSRTISSLSNFLLNTTNFHRLLLVVNYVCLEDDDIERTVYACKQCRMAAEAYHISRSRRFQIQLHWLFITWLS